MVLAKGYGLADVAAGVPAGPATVYPIASVTKQFTAAAIMQLVGQGKLTLGETLPQALPAVHWRDRRAARVTVRELLTHTSGIPGYTSEPGFAAVQGVPQTQRQILSLIVDQPLKFDPGTKAAYSNSGYYLLGMIIERVTGLTYGQYLSRHVLAGLGMTHTRLCPDTTAGGQYARLYDHGAPQPRLAAPTSLVNAFAAGQLCSTAPDLLRWQHALQTGRVVTAASYAAMTTPLRLRSGQTIAYGFGLDLDPINGRRAVSHPGGFAGDAADLAWYPDDHLAIAVLDNASTVPAWTVSADIAKLLLQPEVTPPTAPTGN
jgi:CubicO group peptidase (beta-lactamase class C family)